MMEIIKDKFGKDIAILENDLISGWIKEHGRLDFDQSALPQVLKYVKDGDVVIDGGAYCGDWAYGFAVAVGNSGVVYAMEPNPIPLEALKFNVKDLPQVRIYDKALSYCGDKNNYIIDYNTDNVGASFLTKKEKGSQFSMCIDSLSLTKLNLLKIDCEGFEYRILQGAKKTIERLKPILCLEINSAALERQGHTPQMVFDFLNEMNYIYRNIYEEQPMAGLQYDILCFPK